MRALVVYESMFGNTHVVAERIAAGLWVDYDVEVASVGDVIDRDIGDVDLVVVGGPTHVHGLSRHTTRLAAANQADKDHDLALDPSAAGPGLREWLHGLPKREWGWAAAFDTRAVGPELITGSAARSIARQLTKRGFSLVAMHESFLVDRQNHLLPGEADRAEEWGEALTAHVPVHPHPFMSR